MMKWRWVIIKMVLYCWVLFLLFTGVIETRTNRVRFERNAIDSKEDISTSTDQSGSESDNSSSEFISRSTSGYFSSTSTTTTNNNNNNQKEVRDEGLKRGGKQMSIGKWDGNTVNYYNYDILILNGLRVSKDKTVAAACGKKDNKLSVSSFALEMTQMGPVAGRLPFHHFHENYENKVKGAVCPKYLQVEDLKESLGSLRAKGKIVLIQIDVSDPNLSEMKYRSATILAWLILNSFLGGDGPDRPFGKFSFDGVHIVYGKKTGAIAGVLMKELRRISKLIPTLNSIVIISQSLNDVVSEYVVDQCQMIITSKKGLKSLKKKIPFFIERSDNSALISSDPFCVGQCDITQQNPTKLHSKVGRFIDGESDSSSKSIFLRLIFIAILLFLGLFFIFTRFIFKKYKKDTEEKIEISTT